MSEIASGMSSTIVQAWKSASWVIIGYVLPILYHHILLDDHSLQRLLLSPTFRCRRSW